jgi:outer membrane immunogenic protein
MKSRFVVAAISSLALASPAFAADISPAYKAPQLVGPAWSWTGLYIGANAGGGIARNATTQTVLENPPLLVPLESFTGTPAGFVGGGQLGYNYQFAPNWLVGLEGDLQGSTEKDSTCTFVCELRNTQRLDWIATVRGRIGYTNGDWMYYVTGGGAWAGVRQDFALVTPIASLSASTSQTNGGWTVGGGMETHLGGNWTGKAEYLYMDLGHVSNQLTVPGVETMTTTSDLHNHVIRLGLNYKLF